ncbi:energy transducer TonB [Desulfatirhabdium butyrativorans]|uniref:energy transducer TonB n=1 Tax=Desulfatirhabdium butyrativorans TaxID=340467 RepID=UPI000412D092|nr:energy transducer TonB [Desulfatirhabdium butyrativorans]
MIKTWQCILLALVAHGLIFCLPLTPKASREPMPETIQLVITDPPPPPPPQDPITPMVTEPPRVSTPLKPLPVARKTAVKVAKQTVQPAREKQPEPTPLPKPEESEEFSPQTGKEPAPDPEPGIVSQPSAAASTTASSGPVSVASAGPPIESKIGAIGGPQFVHRSLPQYPRIARRMGVEGTVILRLAIDASGNLTSAEVVQSAGHGFDEEALRAVRQSRFAPAVRQGRPIPCLALLQIRFQLNTGD